jgi:hypothetical protein
VTSVARLQVARATYGAALVLVPGPVIRLATGQLPSRRACRVAQVLGIRHLTQAALTAAAPERAVLTTGGQVDAVHAASMLLLAAVSRAGRRAALTDALTEAAFAAAGVAASRDGLAARGRSVVNARRGAAVRRGGGPTARAPSVPVPPHGTARPGLCWRVAAASARTELPSGPRRRWHRGQALPGATRGSG